MSLREYRSNMFSMLLRQPRYALDVYNALNNSDYTDESLVEISFLENGISLSIRNDASFFMNDNLNIYEQQATVNPNMPLRELIYLVELLKDYVDRYNLNLFDTKLVRIPNPRFVVFYNGSAKYPEIQELRLSDAYLAAEECPELELICTVYNINPNNNEELKARCLTLHHYTNFVEAVKARGPFGNDKTKLKKALQTVVSDFIRNGFLKEFLEEHGNEVIEMETLDFTFERREALLKKEYYNDGRLDVIRTFLSNGGDEYDAKSKLNATDDEILAAKCNVNKCR